jgi:hypothetical protein
LIGGKILQCLRLEADRAFGIFPHSAAQASNLRPNKATQAGSSRHLPFDNE